MIPTQFAKLLICPPVVQSASIISITLDGTKFGCSLMVAHKVLGKICARTSQRALMIPPVKQVALDVSTPARFWVVPTRRLLPSASDMEPTPSQLPTTESADFL